MVVLENHADQCDTSNSIAWDMLENVSGEGASQAHLVDGLKSYRDFEKHRYIHLVDGGISNNLGLRATLDRQESVKERKKAAITTGARLPKNIIVILVNADVDAEVSIEQSPESPSMATTMGAFTSTQMELYSQETRDRMRKETAEFNARAAASGIPSKMYFSEVSFDGVKSDSLKTLLNSMPTSLELEDNQVNQLITAGRILLRQDSAFQRFLENNEGQLVDDTITAREICNYLEIEECTQ